jgi:hypothetical protein
VTGKFKTWEVGHEVVFGSTGYRFASWSPKTAIPNPVYLCKLGTILSVCFANIANP